MMQRAIGAKAYDDSYREELRVLYVAMTRARNKLIMVGTCGSEEDLMKYTMRPRNYLKVMRNVLGTGANIRKIAPLERQQASLKTRTAGMMSSLEGELSSEETRLYEEISRRFGFRYPGAELLTAKAKYSVSELRRKELEETGSPEGAPVSAEDNRSSRLDDEVVNLRIFTEEKKKAGAADIGIAYHRIMEFIDFGLAAGRDGSVDEEYIAERADLLVKNNAIDPGLFDSIDLSGVAEFFRSGIGRRAAEAARAGRLMKEKAFTLRTVREGVPVLVQGVIDCCFCDDSGNMTLIDYKSSFVRPGAAHEREIGRIRREYRTQVELYSEAVLKGTGMPVSEAYLYLFVTGEFIDMKQQLSGT
jgi:ATP-dependent helicase/nuclease subunit A